LFRGSGKVSIFFLTLDASQLPSETVKLLLLQSGFRRKDSPLRRRCRKRQPTSVGCAQSLCGLKGRPRFDRLPFSTSERFEAAAPRECLLRSHQTLALPRATRRQGYATHGLRHPEGIAMAIDCCGELPTRSIAEGVDVRRDEPTRRASGTFVQRAWYARERIVLLLGVKGTAVRLRGRTNPGPTPPGGSRIHSAGFSKSPKQGSAPAQRRPHRKQRMRLRRA
jgi:hypothetical protein